MSRYDIIRECDFERVLLELEEEEDRHEGEDCSDVDDDEVVQNSDHDSNSEIDGNVSGDNSDEEVSGCDDNNYYIKTVYQKQKIRGKTVKIPTTVHKWKKTPVKSKFARTPSKNILKSILPFPKDCADVKDEISAFFKIINIEMIDSIVTYTNMYIKSKRTAETTKKSISDRCATDTDRSEIMAFMGILFLLGTKKMSKLNLEEAWARDGTGIEILQGTMGLRRFRFLLTAIRFDDKSTRPGRRAVDKLAAIREFYDTFNKNCQKFYSPGDQLTIDEKLEPFRGRCSFIQYIPNKPAKYGLKVFAIVDSRTYYSLKLELYCGTQPPGPYEASNASTDIVYRLIDLYKGSKRNLTTDNWYTSYPLALSLLGNGITTVGTLKRNKKEIPEEFLPHKTRVVGTSLFGFQKDITMVSYTTKKNKCVILLSTAHDDDKLDPETNKPEIIMDYNRFKGGVDTVDQLCGNYTVSRKTNRWTLAFFFSLQNIAGINAQILLNYADPKASPKFRRIFLKNLATSLIKPYLQQRAKLHNLPVHSKAIIRRLLAAEVNEEQDLLPPPPKKQKGRCTTCGRGKNNYTTISCSKCSEFTCKSHVAKTITICLTCENNDNNDDEDL